MAEKQGGLSVWHLTMMALGTVIGGSFFLGSAIAIRTAGPSILISFVLGGLLVYVILMALSEMTISQPAVGSFRTYAEQMYGPGVGFVTGWVYWAGLTLAMSSEALAASVFLRAWVPGLPAPLIAIMIVVSITLLNLAGARTLSSLEGGLAFIKLFALAAFIVLAVALIGGFFPGIAPIGLGVLTTEPFFPAGLAGIAGSMLIVMFSYAGFEIIGLAASEAANPHRTVPKAIAITILGLVGLYCLSVTLLLPLIRTSVLTEKTSPLVAGLVSAGIPWAARVISAVLLTAILSTMLAAMFGMGRMIRSLAEVRYAPSWLREKQEVPIRGILFSGSGMLAGVTLAYVLPKHIYLFLVSAGGFSLLFTYAVIMATHYKYRKVNGCPPKGNCQLWGYPYTSLIGQLSLIVIIISMPLVPGQGSGLLAGLVMVLLFALGYVLLVSKAGRKIALISLPGKEIRGKFTPLVNMEAAEEMAPHEAANNIETAAKEREEGGD